SRPVQEVSEDTAEVASLISSYTAENARTEAQSIASSPQTTRAYASGDFSGVMGEFQRHEITMQGGFALALSRASGVEPLYPVTDNWTAEASFRAPEAWPLLRPKLPADLSPGIAPAQVTINGRLYTQGVAK